MHAFRRDGPHRDVRLSPDVTIRRAAAGRDPPRQYVDARETYIRIPSPSPPTHFPDHPFPPHGHRVREDRPEPRVRVVPEDRFEPRKPVVRGSRRPIVSDHGREATSMRGQKRFDQSAAGPDARENPTGFVRRLPGQSRLSHNEDATFIYLNPLAPEDIVDRKSLLTGDDIETSWKTLRGYGG